jgi:prepilin-type N-terminal cleavage/methylation domain-containing protein
MCMSAFGRRRGEAGFTLVELMVTMLIGSVLAAIGGAGVLNWQRQAEQQGSSLQLLSQLRKAAERAVSEGRTYCVDFTPSRSYTLWQHGCGAGGTVAEATRSTQSKRVTLAPTLKGPGAAPACASGDTCVYFYPRGTATAATILVRSSARGNVYTIHVEGLTARVYA